jgi:dolichol-phosphate mannosyltransferase
MKLTVVVPVYNERDTLLDILKKIGEVPVLKEIILVDDGSTDGTRDIISRHLSGRDDIRVILHPHNCGKGKAVRTGIEAASGDAVIIQDADLEYDPMDYKVLLNAMQERNAEVVFGSRFLSGKKVTSAIHRLVNFTLTWITNILFASKLTDMETCYKLFRTPVIRNLGLTSDGFEIEAEITCKLLKARILIIEVPVSYRGRGYDQGKKITWIDGVKAVWTLIKLRLAK